MSAELAEFKHRCDDQQRALQQAQAYRTQLDSSVSAHQAELAELRYVFNQMGTTILGLLSSNTIIAQLPSLGSMSIFKHAIAMPQHAIFPFFLFRAMHVMYPLDP